jgi:hypothetical protein
LFVVYLIFHFVIGKSAPPLLQKHRPPVFEVTDADYFLGGDISETSLPLNDGAAELPPPEEVQEDDPAEPEFERPTLGSD